MCYIHILHGERMVYGETELSKLLVFYAVFS